MFEQQHKTVDQVRALNLQAECLSNLGKCDVAGQLLQNSLEKINNEDDKTVLADTYYYLARHAGGCARKFDEAIGLMRKSLTIKEQIYKPGNPSFALDYTFLGYIYNSKGQYDSALIYLNQAMKIRENDNDIEKSHTLFNLAASYEGKSELGKSLGINMRALQIRSQQLGTSHATVANSINSIGRVYRKLGNHERALEYYRQALEIRKTTLGAAHPNVAGSYYEIGNLYGSISNYHSAIEYIQQGNRILESNSQVSNDVLVTYYAYAGKMYGLIGDDDNARSLIQKGVSEAEKKLPDNHPFRAVVYNIAGEYWGDKGDLKKQSDFFKKAIAIYQSSYGAGSEREADVVSRMAATYARLGYPKEALKAYDDALKMYTIKVGQQNPKTVSVQLGIGDAYAGNGNVDAAQKAYRQAGENVGGNNKALALRISKSQALLFEEKWPKDALAFYRTSLQLIDEISADYNNEAARIQLEKERRAIHIGAMNAAWKLYSAGDPSMLAEAFVMAEKSKAALLLENTRDQHAKTMAGVPDSLVNKERDLRIELAYYKTSLYQAQKNKDTAATRAFEKNIFDLQRTLEQFKSRLEIDFPAYFRLKYTKPAVELAGIQKLLAENTTLLEYFVGDSAIYCFEITRNAAQFNMQSYDKAFKNTVDGYQRSLTDAQLILNKPTTADSLYASTARSLFTLLMLPQPSAETTQKIIIIPDDFLAQFNFGTLLYEDVKDKNYGAFPYVSNRYVISYAYSAAFPGDAVHHGRRSNEFAGFAPSYEQADYKQIDSTQHPMAALVVRTGNLPLPGAALEVDMISKMMNGRSWMNEDATETNFKKYSGDFDVLHLAMHSLLNAEEPRYSELLFNHRNDTVNDGYLTIAEIYNLKLNAQLVVLSACSSGFGKIQHGEGPISLSRAFSYAGCPSVVMSLWKVPDQITTTIMKNFYEGLTSGKNKDEALREAQMKFLSENNDPLYRHPYYWAGFVVIGDTSPLESSPSRALLYGLGVLIFVGTIAIVRSRRKSVQSTTSKSRRASVDL